MVYLLNLRLWLINSSKCRSFFLHQQTVRLFTSKRPDIDGRKVPVFEVSVDGAGKADFKTEVKDLSSTALKRAKQKDTANLKTRKLRLWDKQILVKLGKYEKIEDVPDEITYSSVKDKVIEEKVRAEIKEKLFKYYVGMDYFLWTLCLLFTVPLWYMYFNQSKSKDAEEKKNNDDT